METIYRVQDKEGRGPWKPGFSRFWVEGREDHANLVPWYAEFGRVEQTATRGMYVACGCRSVEQLRRWFTPSEYTTLRMCGYQAVLMIADQILAGSDIQCVFERMKPLHTDIEDVELYS